MGRITGRPKQAIIQEKFVGFFMTNKQYFIVRQKADEAGVNISDYMRQVAIYGQVKARWSEEERTIFKGLVGIANDINQLVVLAKKAGMSDEMLYFMKYRDKMDKIINRFCHDE